MIWGLVIILKTDILGLECNLVVDSLTKMHKTLSSISSTARKKKKSILVAQV
jgi:hypothetical protein